MTAFGCLPSFSSDLLQAWSSCLYAFSPAPPCSPRLPLMLFLPVGSSPRSEIGERRERYGFTRLAALLLLSLQLPSWVSYWWLNRLFPHGCFSALFVVLCWTLLQLPVAIWILLYFSWPFVTPASACGNPVTPFQPLPLRLAPLLCYPVGQEPRQDELELSLAWLTSIPRIFCPVNPEAAGSYHHRAQDDAPWQN